MRKIFTILTVLVVTAACISLVGCKDKPTVEYTDPTIRYNLVISATELEIEEGQKNSLTATCGDKIVVFTSADPLVATVDAYGNITAVSVGTTYVKATSQGQEGICKVTVIKNDWSVMIEGEESITAVNMLNKEFVAVVYKNGERTNETVKWTVSDESVDLYNDGNTVRFYVETAGTYTLTATFNNVSTSTVVTVITE